MNPVYDQQDPEVVWPRALHEGLWVQCWSQFSPALFLGVQTFELIRANLELDWFKLILTGDARWEGVTGDVSGYTLHLDSELDRIFAWVAFDNIQHIENANFAVDWTIDFGIAEHFQRKMWDISCNGQ